MTPKGLDQAAVLTSWVHNEQIETRLEGATGKEPDMGSNEEQREKADME